ncbi:MAG TPA: hypothetical protein VGD64_04050 [Acidisarcina sp.]
MTKNQLKLISIASSILWASAVIASAILKAPTFLTIILLPMLAFTSLTSIQAIGRRAGGGSGICR